MSKRQKEGLQFQPFLFVAAAGPEESQGNVIGSLNRRRGAILDTTTIEGTSTVVTEVPLKEMFGYSGEIRSQTQGKGSFSMEFEKYMPCTKGDQDVLVKEYQEKRKLSKIEKERKCPRNQTLMLWISFMISDFRDFLGLCITAYLFI